jgi:predicted amidohydrolase YtcJ
MVELTLPVLGPERSSWQYPFASLVRAGARLCFGSDWSVSTPDVMAQVHVAVNRTAPPGEAGSGDDAGAVAFLPDERVDLETALRAFTMGSAYANHLDEETGSITAGKRADLVVLDRDVFSAPSSEIGLARVDLTFVDGEIVHAAP